ncbi:MAG: hypothetical protein ACYDBQ_12340 [Thermoplasmatota archaeon]
MAAWPDPEEPIVPEGRRITMRARGHGMSDEGEDWPRAAELLLQALACQRACAAICDAALSLAYEPEVRKEWRALGARARYHEGVLLELFSRVGLAAPAADPVLALAALGPSLLSFMAVARGPIVQKPAQLPAAICVSLAATVEELNWDLMSRILPMAPSAKRAALEFAVTQVRGILGAPGRARKFWF